MILQWIQRTGRKLINKISRYQGYDGKDGRLDHCTNCGLTIAQSRGKQCPMYGTQCNVREKCYHFSFVCSANIKWNQEEVMDSCYTHIIMGRRNPV